MPKGKYSRPLNRDQRKITKKLKTSGNTKNTLSAASHRRRRNNDIFDKIPALGKRKDVLPPSAKKRKGKK